METTKRNFEKNPRALKADNDLHRDKVIAREFRQRSANSNISDTRLKEQIGCKYGLKRSASIAAANRGLRVLAAQEAHPNHKTDN